MTTEHTKIPRATGYRILHDPGSQADPVLVLTTKLGDHHYVLSRPLLQKLAVSCEKASREGDES